MSEDSVPDRPGPLTAADVDLALVAEDLAGALDPRRATDLASLLSRDRGAADRYAQFSRELDSLAVVLADHSAPPVPDDVVLRLDAAFQREVAARDATATATATAHAAVRRLTPARRRRPVAGWAAALGAVAAVVALLTVVVHTGGATGSSSSATSPLTQAGPAASLRAQAGSGSAASSSIDGSSAAQASSAGGASAAATAPEAVPAPGTTGRRAVTAATLASVVRAIYPAHSPGPRSPVTVGASPSPAASPGLAVTRSRPGEPGGCRPAGTPARLRLLATTPVTFDGRPAVLLVLAGDPAQPGTVRAAVVRGCGGRPLLTRLVAVGD